MSQVCVLREQMRLHESHTANVSAGTSFVLDDTSRPNLQAEVDSKLKYDKSGPVPIILVPQPSDDPNDPLVGHYFPRLLHLAINIFRIGRYGSVTRFSASYASLLSSPQH